jgi:DNA-binding HxlR family transcriptional regulator
MAHLLALGRMALAARPRKHQKMELRRPARLITLGVTMKGYGQFCPVAKAAEIVAERWTPLVLRELLCGSRRFSALHRGVPLMSPTLLAQRLEQLEDAGSSGACRGHTAAGASMSSPRLGRSCGH